MNAPKHDNGWSWFTDRVLPGLFVALALAVAGVQWTMYNAISSITNKVENLEKKQIELEGEIKSVRMASVTRSELLETLKRVEQQLEIVLLRAGVKTGTVKLSKE